MPAPASPGRRETSRHSCGSASGDAAAPAAPSDREESYAAWRRFLESAAARHPLVLVFEDLHWADPALIAFVDHLVDWSTGVPITVICTARPELYERHPGWGGGKRNSATISLSPLTDEETAKLVKWLASVRGPESKDPPFVALPRPQGRQTRVVITEYELPRLELATHDVAGDSKGNIWYSPHRSSYIGRLDTRTGADRWKTDRGRNRSSYTTPVVVQAATGPELIVNSSERVDAYDPRTGAFLWHVGGPNQFPIPVPTFHDGIIYMSRGYRSSPFMAIRPCRGFSS